MIAFKDLPDAVKKGLARSRFAKAKVLRVERVTAAQRSSAPTYELVVEIDGKKHEVAFDTAGKLLSTERAEEEG